MAFQIATKYSCAEVFEKASPVILEPVMDVEVTVPLEYQSAIMGQLVKRRGSVTNTETR
jgi:elongation factor G